MSGFSGQSQMDVQFPPNLPIPTYFTNVVKTGILEDEAYLDFCMRSIEKPLLRADLQCRIVTTVTSLRRLSQGLSALLAQHDKQLTQAQAAQVQAEAQAAAQRARSG